jgi:meso-butanediol dehydrogenase/(S,S)-butanediol dehydrogenase/diacetyl reductase
MSLNGKVALITGGGTGIGEAVARLLAANGAHALVMGRRAEPVQRIAQVVGGIPVVGDAADAATVRDAVSLAEERFGGLDILVHCAGSFKGGAVGETTDQAWQRSLHTNLTTAFVSSREVLPAMMRRGGGSIVMLSSIAGLQSMPQAAGYVTAKHALIGLTRSLAFDYGAHKIRVNAVCPGWVRTPMADDEMKPVMQRDGLTLDQAYGLVTSDIPLKRAANPAEIAEVCRFLVDDASSILTGTVIATDAGSTIVCAPTIRM